MIPRLHLVTDDGILGRESFRDGAEALLEAGGPALALHLRGPGARGLDLHELGATLAPEARASGSLLLINDRVDVALALRLRAVHLGQRSLPPEVARALLGEDATLGLSVHGGSELPEGGDRSLDYLIVGTLFPTASHPGREGRGVGLLQEIRSRSSLPLVGIGGITPRRVEAVVRAGAHGVAVRGGIWDAPDPVGALKVYLDVLVETIPGGAGVGGPKARSGGQAAGLEGMVP